MKARITHGLAVGKLHPLYRLLHNMKARCYIPSATHYEYYGGRGITVDESWRTNPKAFIQWALAAGWRRGLEVDRIDPDGPYSPENCRIVTHQENSQRTRRIKTTAEQAAQVKALLAQGVSMKNAARQVGVSYMVAWHIKNSPGVWSNA